MKEQKQVRFGLDLDEIRALTLDYFQRDLRPVVESPPDSANIHLIIAAVSETYSPAAREQALQIASSNPRVTVDIIPGVHLLHVDNPDGLLDRLVTLGRARQSRDFAPNLRKANGLGLSFRI